MPIELVRVGGHAGRAAGGGGGAAIGVGAAAEGPSLGTSTALVGAGVAAVGAGTTMVGGAIANLEKLVNTPTQMGRFSDQSAQKIDAKNSAKNGGNNACENCGKPVEKVQNKKGVKTPDNQLQRHHKNPVHKGGSDNPRNGEILCPPCHKEKHKKK